MRYPVFRYFRLLGLGFVLTLAGSAHAISLSSLDTFDSDEEAWEEGGPSPNPPTWVNAAGSDGFTLGYLENSSDASGAGGRQLMWNDSAEWTGDYTAAGVGTITLYIDNRSDLGSTLPVRLALNGAGGFFASAPQMVLDATEGDDWTQISFGLTAGNFTYLTGSGGTGIFADTLSGVTRLELLVSEEVPPYAAGGNVAQGDNFFTDLAFDNIQAIPQPTAASLFLLALGGAALGLRRVRRR